MTVASAYTCSEGHIRKGLFGHTQDGGAEVLRMSHYVNCSTACLIYLDRLSVDLDLAPGDGLVGACTAVTPIKLLQRFISFFMRFQSTGGIGIHNDVLSWPR